MSDTVAQAAPNVHPMAPEHLPRYLVAADGGDYLFTVMIFLTLAALLGLGLLYFTLHSLPERMAHGANHMQLQLISILVLLALFTHNNAFWVLAILIAAFRMPDFLSPIRSIARSLNRLARQNDPVAAGPKQNVAADPVVEDVQEQPSQAPATEKTPKDTAAEETKND